MNNYDKWAKENPTLTAEYRKLQNRLNGIEENIAIAEQSIESAKRGLVPQGLSSGVRTMSLSKAGNPFSPNYPNTPNAYTVGFAEIQDELRRERLEGAIKHQKSLLNGYTGLCSHEGYYAERDNALKVIKDFVVVEHPIDWRDGLENAIDKRVTALAQRDDLGHFDSLDGLMDAISVINFAGAELEVATIPHSIHWRARVFDKHVSFTRVSMDYPHTAIQRATLAYLEHRWNALCEYWQR